jgi:flagellar protein FlaG
MFNSSLDAYGAIKRPAAVQNTAGGQNVISVPTSPAGLKSIDRVENRPPVESKPDVESRPPVQVDKAVLTSAVNKLNELVAPALQSVQFTIDEETDRIIVRVVDTATQKVLRQIPNEEVLAFSKTLGRLQGLVVREKV